MESPSTTGSEKFDAYYNFVDEKMIEGDEEAQSIIEKHGYSVDKDMLYDFVERKMLDGDEVAEKLIKKFGYIY